MERTPQEWEAHLARLDRQGRALKAALVFGVVALIFGLGVLALTIARALGYV